MKTKEHTEYKQFVQWKKGDFNQSFSKSRCKTQVIVVSMDMITFNKVFLVEFFLHVALMATVTLRHLTLQHTS